MFVTILWKLVDLLDHLPGIIIWDPLKLWQVGKSQQSLGDPEMTHFGDCFIFNRNTSFTV